VNDIDHIPTQALVTVTLVHARACHFCEDAQAALADIAQEYPVRVALVAAESEHGQALIRAHRAGMFPLVLLDGGYFSAGRLPRGKLRKRLQARADAARVGVA
jgi:hypothetical protein